MTTYLTNANQSDEMNKFTAISAVINALFVNKSHKSTTVSPMLQCSSNHINYCYVINVSVCFQQNKMENTIIKFVVSNTVWLLNERVSENAYTETHTYPFDFVRSHFMLKIAVCDGLAWVLTVCK